MNMLQTVRLAEDFFVGGKVGRSSDWTFKIRGRGSKV